MGEGWIVASFLIGLGLVLAGWWGLLRLSFALEKKRFGWSDDEALTRFLSMRRASEKRGQGHMRAYIDGELRVFAEGTGAGRRYRLARWLLRLGYGALILAVIAWFTRSVMALW